MEPCEVYLVQYSLFAAFTLLFLSTTIYGDYKFIQFFGSTGKNKRLNLLSVIGSVYLCITTALLLFYIIYSVYLLSNMCDLDITNLNGSSTFLAFDTLKDILYCSQMYGLWLLLFTRLRFIFKDSAYMLSRCTVITYSCILTIIPVPFILMFLPIWSGDLNELGSDVFIVASSLFTFSMLFCLSITALFLYKLCRVYSTENTAIDPNESLLPV
eukprot:346527_1